MGGDCMKRGERRRKKDTIDEDLRLALSRQDLNHHEVDDIMNGHESQF